MEIASGLFALRNDNPHNLFRLSSIPNHKPLPTVYLYKYQMLGSAMFKQA